MADVYDPISQNLLIFWWLGTCMKCGGGNLLKRFIEVRPVTLSRDNLISVMTGSLSTPVVLTSSSSSTDVSGIFFLKLGIRWCCRFNV